MNLLTLKPLTLLIAASVLAAAAFCTGWQTNGWRLGKQISGMERDQAFAAEAASETARLKEHAWSKQLEEARNAATNRETTLRSAAAAARGAADGLRDDLAELRRQLPKLAAEACRQRADALADVFGQCTARYSELAEKADRHANDVRTLSEAWPDSSAAQY